jgi:hypothetical protein
MLQQRAREVKIEPPGKGRAGAVLMLVPGRIASSPRTQVADLAIKERLAAIYQSDQVSTRHEHWAIVKSMMRGPFIPEMFNSWKPSNRGCIDIG